MNKAWVHKEYQIGPWTCRPAESEKKPCPAPAAIRVDPSIIITLAAVITLLATVPLIILKIKTSERPAVISSALPSLKALDTVDKRRLLSRLSMHQRREALAKVQYLSREIMAINPAVDAHRLAATIVLESVKAHYDPFLVTAVILAESTFRSTARSYVGARGLMQIRPSTGSYVCEIQSADWEGEQALHDPQYNIRLGIAYLKHLEGLYNKDIQKALIAYNWGPGNLDRALARGKLKIPAVTERYVSKILRYRQKWKDGYEPFRGEIRYASNLALNG